MPVHSREKKENNHDEMEVDYGENEGSSSEEEESESSSVSEEGDSSGAARVEREGARRTRGWGGWRVAKRQPSPVSLLSAGAARPLRSPFPHFLAALSRAVGAHGQKGVEGERERGFCPNPF